MSQPIKNEAPFWRQSAVEVAAGGLGGAVGIFFSAPAMYVKTYFQLKAKNPQSHPPFEKNPVKWFAGGTGLAAWMFPQAAFLFMMNEALKAKLSKNWERELTSGEKLACSVATGGMISPVVNVQELIWTQQKVAEGEGHPKSAMQVTREIWAKHGMRGFLRGGGETTVREMVSSSVLTYLAAEHPVLAPVVGATLSQPVDGRKTAKQADFAYTAPLKQMLRPQAFSGLAGRMAVYLIFMNVAPRVNEQVKSWAGVSKNPDE